MLAAGVAGLALGLLHGLVCSLPRVNDIAVGIGLMLFGTGLAFFLGKPYVQPKAPTLPAIPLGDWSGSPQVQAALQVNPLFLLGVALAVGARLGVPQHALGTGGAHGRRQLGRRARDGLRRVSRADALRRPSAASLAGIGGSFLSLYYPGSWNEGLSSGQGLMAVALVIFARWNPLQCFYAALLFGGAGALGPALQSVGITCGYYLFNAAPYVVTLGDHDRDLLAASHAGAARPASSSINRTDT